MLYRLGRPTLFVTFTCNPGWEEIQPPGDPAMTARVFKLKLQALLDELKKGTIFGLPPCTYFFQVVEFQKRGLSSYLHDHYLQSQLFESYIAGLPHAHIIISFNRRLSTEEVDRIIRADLPGEDEPELRALVLRHMVHGPCGPRNPNCVCMDRSTKTCTKHFPKPASEFTFVDDRGYHNYRRPCNTVATIRRGGKDHEITDMDIVPYNPTLLQRYNAHINVEVANTTRAVKYLFKYACKGQDRVKSLVAEEGTDVDEIKEYENNRLLSASEAMWRIFAFPLQNRLPAVKPIAIHLEDRDWLIFKEDNPEAALRQSSELRRYFDRPQGPEFDDLTICSYYETFREDTRPTASSVPHPNGRHHLIRRVKTDFITRLHWV